MATVQAGQFVKLDHVVYKTLVHTTGGRKDGMAKSDDGRLDLALTLPNSSSPGTNPEQLFAAAFSSCFIGSIKKVAEKQDIHLNQDPSIDATVELGSIQGQDGFAIKTHFLIVLQGIEKSKGEKLIEDARKICPYVIMTRGNMEFTYTLQQKPSQ